MEVIKLGWAKQSILYEIIALTLRCLLFRH
jgi:hypothetical protein